MKKGIVYDNSKKAFPIIIMAIGFVLAIALQVMRLNLLAVVNVGYMCIVVTLTILGLLIFNKLYLWNFIGYLSSAVSIVAYYTIWGADAGFGAFSSGKAGWNSVENALFSGADNYNILVRLGGNVLLILPCIIALVLLFKIGKKIVFVIVSGVKQGFSVLHIIEKLAFCIFVFA